MPVVDVSPPPPLDALFTPAATVDADGTVRDVNGRLADLLGESRASLTGRRLLDFSPHDDARLCDVLADFATPGEGECDVRRRDGRVVPVYVSAGMPADGRRVVLFTDLTARRDEEIASRERFETIARLSDTFLASAEGLKDYSEELERRVAERTQALHEANRLLNDANRLLHEANLDAVYMLAVASEAKDHDTGLHVRRLRGASRAIARELGFADADADAIGTAAVLHDVGKLHVPDRILRKPGPLTDDERRTVERHTVIGERILSDRPFFDRARRIARAHHENFDGSGYPDALAGDAIPIEARIVHLADVFDALTHARSYKPAWTPETAVGTIEGAAGTQFDPQIVAAFTSLWRRGAYA